MYGRMFIKSSTSALFIGCGLEWMGTRDAVPKLVGLPLLLGFTFTCCSKGFSESCRKFSKVYYVNSGGVIVMHMKKAFVRIHAVSNGCVM